MSKRSLFYKKAPQKIFAPGAPGGSAPGDRATWTLPEINKSFWVAGRAAVFLTAWNSFLASKMMLTPPDSIDFSTVKTYPDLNPVPYGLMTLDNL